MHGSSPHHEHKEWCFALRARGPEGSERDRGTCLPGWPLYPSSPAFLSGQQSSVLSGSKPTFNVTKIHRASNGPGDADGFKAKLGVKWPRRLVKGGTSIKAKILCVGGTSGGTAWVPGDGHR